MPLCSASGCSNRSHKDPEKRLSFIICRLATKSWQKVRVNQLRRNARFMTKHFRMSTFVMNFTGDCYEVSYRYEMLGEKTRKRNSESVLSQFLAPLGLNKPSKILRLQ